MKYLLRSLKILYNVFKMSIILEKNILYTNKTQVLDLTLFDICLNKYGIKLFGLIFMKFKNYMQNIINIRLELHSLSEIVDKIL